MEVLKKFKASSYAVMVIYIIVGLIMLLNPSFIGNAVNYVIGVLLIIYGLIYTVSEYQKNRDSGKFDLLAGVLCISFGLFLIVHKDILLSLIPFSCGVIILMDSVGCIIKSFSLKKLQFTRWWINLIVGFILLGFSIYIILHAEEITELLIKIIGGILIFDALFDLITSIRINRKVGKIESEENAIIVKD